LFGKAKRHVCLIAFNELQHQHDKETTFGSATILSPVTFCSLPLLNGAVY